MFAILIEIYKYCHLALVLALALALAIARSFAIVRNLALAHYPDDPLIELELESKRTVSPLLYRQHSSLPCWRFFFPTFHYRWGMYSAHSTVSKAETGKLLSPIKSSTKM